MKEVFFYVRKPYLKTSKSDPSKEWRSEVPTSKKNHKVKIIPKALNLGTPKLNSAVQGMAYVDLDMSNLSLFIVHNVLNQLTKELKAREHIVYEQLK